MKKRTLVMLILGAILNIIGFGISNLDDLPILQRLFTRDYYKASSALQTLTRNHQLVPGDEGFLELTKAVLKASKPNDGEGKSEERFVCKQVIFEKTVFARTGTMQAQFDFVTQDTWYPLEPAYRAELLSENVQKCVDGLKKNPTFLLKSLLFAVGLILMVASPVWEVWEKKKEAQIVPHKNDEMETAY